MTRNLDSDIFDRAALPSLRQLRQQFGAAEPFPHLLLHGLFKREFLERVVADFGINDAGDWLRWDTPDEVKRATRSGAKLGPASQAYFDAVHRGDFIQLLTAITGVEGLLPDPTLFGGGLHEIPDGGRFGVHTDFNKHPVTGLDNRLVMITYLNPGWKPGYGGCLELWDEGQTACLKEINPVLGDTILFAHSERSLHGHPGPVCAPDRRSRRSIATYFYSNGRPDAVADGSYRTTRLRTPVQLGPWARAATRAKYFLPPVIVDGLKRINNMR